MTDKAEVGASARNICQQGLEVDPNNQQLKEGLAEVEEKIETATNPGNTGAQDNPFQDANLLERLRNHPKTKAHLNDPTFAKILEELQSGPEALLRHVRDPRVMDILSVMLGVDLKEEAMKKKELGNAAYKKREFDEALQHYDRALELDPDNITFMTNKAAVYFEQKEWEACLKECESAVEKGREMRADFKLIAKALARMGRVYYQQKQWKEAIKYFDKSLTEHRTAKVLENKKNAEEMLKEEEERS